jgi:hypothetical protein
MSPGLPAPPPPPPTPPTPPLLPPPPIPAAPDWPTTTLSEAPGVTGARAVTVVATPPASPEALAPPCAPSALMVTKQIPAGTVAALV